MADIPKPGTPVRGSKRGKPIMALFDLLGRSWALGVIWQLAEAEVAAQGGITFRALQTRCEGVSPTVLNKRLKELAASNIVERGDGGYQLSSTGRALFQLLQPFGPWSMDWAAGLDPV